MRVKSVGIVSSAKISGALYALMGLIFGAIFALMSLFSQGMWASEANGSVFLGLIFGVGAIVFLPIFYGAMGVVAGAVGAALYNWVAGMIGGLELELE